MEENTVRLGTLKKELEPYKLKSGLSWSGFVREMFNVFRKRGVQIAVEQNIIEIMATFNKYIGSGYTLGLMQISHMAKLLNNMDTDQIDTFAEVFEKEMLELYATCVEIKRRKDN